jgi:hypothetical protein
MRLNGYVVKRIQAELENCNARRNLIANRSALVRPSAFPFRVQRSLLVKLPPKLPLQNLAVVA